MTVPETCNCNCADDEACDGCVPCDICREGLEECCDGDPDCPGCYGAGCRIPEHCCDCGGSACFGGCRSLAAHAVDPADTLPTTTTPDTEASGERGRRLTPQEGKHVDRHEVPHRAGRLA